MTEPAVPRWVQSRPERWWWWLVLVFGMWGLRWIRAAGESPYEVEVTVGKVLASFGLQVLIIGFSVFRAGALYTEHRRRLGLGVSFIRPDERN